MYCLFAVLINQLNIMVLMTACSLAVYVTLHYNIITIVLFYKCTILFRMILKHFIPNKMGVELRIRSLRHRC